MSDPLDVDERQARVDALIAEFRAAQERRRVKIATALWNRSESALRDIVPTDLAAETIKH